MTKQAKKLRDMELEELKIKLESAKKDYAKEIVKHKTGSRNEKAVSLSVLRKNIARIMTIITEKEYAVLKTENKKEKQNKEQK